MAEFVEATGKKNDLDRPLVAASIGPYGAVLADGSEYHGQYGVSKEKLKSFHAPRLELILRSQPDLLACETIPGRQEAEVLRELLVEMTKLPTWVSFSCRDGERISDGHRLSHCVDLFEDVENVFAVGVNCTKPDFVPSLIGQIQDNASDKRIVVYPNSGQTYDAKNRNWKGQSSASEFGQQAKRWFDAGATLIGGCCQTGPDHIRAIRAAIPAAE